MTTARPVKTRNDGQWALGDREPLNHAEQFKNDDAPLNVRDRIINVYSKQGFDSIAKDDLRGRFRWMGLYTQREQGYDGSWTGDENTDKIEAKYFMMRVRSDGKAMTAHTMRTLGRFRPNSPATPPTSATGKTCSCTGSGSRTCPRSGGGSIRWACRPPRPAVTAPAASTARRWPATRSTKSLTPHPRSTRSSGARSTTPSTPTCPASTRPRSPACRTSRTRPMTSRSSASTTPNTAPAWTCGWAAACRPTRCWPSDWACGSRWTRPPTSGRASPSCSATTATAGCAPRPG